MGRATPSPVQARGGPILVVATQGAPSEAAASRGGFSWRHSAPGVPQPRRLSGEAHGTAGACYSYTVHGALAGVEALERHGLFERGCGGAGGSGGGGFRHLHGG